jgi:GT2 family glycosyltransferase
VDRSESAPPLAKAAQRRAAVVIVSYNSAPYLTTLLAGLREAAPRTDLDVHVVDNGSSDDSVRVAEAAGAQLIRSPVNGGYAAGINLGLRGVPADWPVVILNPDLTVARGSLDLLLDAVEVPGVGVAAPKILFPDGQVMTSLNREPSLPGAIGDAIIGARMPQRPRWASEHVLRSEAYEAPSDADWVSGAALAVSAASRAAVGEWDESFFLYSEEVDYMRRTREAGYLVRFVPDAVVTHVIGGSGQSPQLAALMTVNKVRYYRRQHGRLASAAYRTALTTHELLRARRAGSRAALRALLSEQSWATLPRATPAGVLS